MRDGLEVLRTMGVTPAEMRIVGGAAQSPLWMRLQRDVFGLPVRTSLSDHGAAYGAALLAAVGVGGFKSAEEASHVARFGHLSQPDPSLVSAYDKVYLRYRRLYPALYEEFRRV